MSKIRNAPINHSLNQIMPVVVSIKNVGGREVITCPKVGLCGVALHGYQHSRPIFGGNTSARYLRNAEHLNNLGNTLQGINHQPARVRLGRMLGGSGNILREPIEESGANSLQGVGLLTNGGKGHFNTVGVVLLLVEKMDGEPSSQDADNQRNEAGYDTGDFHERGSGSANVEVWHRLQGAPLRNRVKVCSKEGHFDSARVAGCPPQYC